MEGVIFLVDSTDRPSFKQAARLINMLTVSSPDIPYIVVATKIDLEGSADLLEVRHGIEVDWKTTVIPCITIQESSAEQVMVEMLKLLKKGRGLAHMLEVPDAK